MSYQLTLNEDEETKQKVEYFVGAIVEVTATQITMVVVYIVVNNNNRGVYRSRGRGGQS